MSGLEGRKAIVMICSGIDTFSRLTFDQTRKKLQESGVPVYPISVGTINREMADATRANRFDPAHGLPAGR